MQKTLPRYSLQSLLQPWWQIDWFLILLPLALTVIGGLMIRSIELQEGLVDWYSHWIVGGLGLGITFWIAKSRYDHLLNWYWWIYAVTNLSLIAVLIIGTVGMGAQSWIVVGGWTIQPSEFAKVGLIITLAAILHYRTARTLMAVIISLAVVAVPWALIFIQPDLGTSLVFGAITLVMLYWAKARVEWLVLLLSPLVAAVLFNLLLPGWFAWTALMIVFAWRSLPWQFVGAIAAVVVNLVSGGLGKIFWNILQDYQKDRLILFLDPSKDPLGGGYHLIQSRIAIGAGQLWGRGLNQGTQTQLNFIPEQHTDFIFSAIGEEWGFIGAIAILALFWLVCLRLVIIAQNAKDNFGSLIAIGVLAMLVFQVIVNIGMTIGVAPITGIPLPWLSYGRSALLTNFIALGLVESIANHRGGHMTFKRGVGDN